MGQRAFFGRKVLAYQHVESMLNLSDDPSRNTPLRNPEPIGEEWSDLIATHTSLADHASWVCDLSPCHMEQQWGFKRFFEYSEFGDRMAAYFGSFLGFSERVRHGNPFKCSRSSRRRYQKWDKLNGDWSIW